MVIGVPVDEFIDLPEPKGAKAPLQTHIPPALLDELVDAHAELADALAVTNDLQEKLQIANVSRRKALDRVDAAQGAIDAAARAVATGKASAQEQG